MPKPNTYASAERYLRLRHQRFAILAAIEYLRKARTECRYAKAPRTTMKVRLALSSALGALRNAECRISRDDRS